MKKLFCFALLALVVAIGFAAFFWPPMWYAFLLLGPIVCIAIYDLVQREHTILRNYPVIGHVRYMLEDMRHHIRQYLIQADREGDPFTRLQRNIVYRRAKEVSDLQAFGTMHDLYAEGAEWMEHSMSPLDPPHDEPRIRVGGPACSKPYDASRFNISAMSFGSLSKNAILALNTGARKGGFAHDTGEGGLSRYHLEPGGDVIWELGTGYFGCRAKDGSFDADSFAGKADYDSVKMIEIKLSQGAKPGGGGILPAAKVSDDIAAARGIEKGYDVISPPRHSAFSTPLEMMTFIAELRDLCGGKPVGLKLCIGQRAQFLALCKAMLQTEILPDFITVDGKEGGTGAAPVEFSDHLGAPLTDGLVLVHNALVGTGLREHIRLIASGKIINGFDIAARIAIGADMCNSARGMMFALGCIQARRCHTNTCPSGVATQDPWRVSGLVVNDKAQRVAAYHKSTVHHFLKLISACGLADPSELRPEHLKRRLTSTKVSDYRAIYQYLEPNMLIDGNAPVEYREVWAQADPACF